MFAGIGMACSSLLIVLPRRHVSRNMTVKSDAPCYGSPCCHDGCPASTVEAYKEMELKELQASDGE